LIILFLILFLLVPVILAVSHRTALVNISLLIGMVPMTLGREGMTEGFYGRMDVMALRLLGIWIAACFIILGNFDRTIKYIRLYRMHLFFLMFCCLSLIWSPSLAYGLRMFAKLSSPFLFMLVIMSTISSKKELDWMEKLMLAGGIGIVILAILTKVFHLDPSTTLTVPGTTSAYFAAYMVSMGVLALSNVMYQKPLNYLILVFIFTCATLAAFTRTTIAAMFVAYTVMFFLSGKGFIRILLPCAGLIGLPSLFLFNETFKKRMFYGENKINFESIQNDPSLVLSHLDGSGRFSAWPQVLKKLFYPNPVTGSGLGATQNFFYSGAEGGLGAVHSEYIRLLSDVGLIGLILFSIAMLIYLIRLVRTYFYDSNSSSGKYALAATGGLLTYLVFMAADNAIDYVTGFGLYVFGMIAMCDKAKELDRVEISQTDTNTYPIPVQGGFEQIPGISGRNGYRKYPIIDRKELKNAT
jgi:O-antigen ligase/polysaccharide polymerase Wzy-like membrane protein